MTHIEYIYSKLVEAIDWNKDHVSDTTIVLLTQLYRSLKSDIDKAPGMFTVPFKLNNGVKP